MASTLDVPKMGLVVAEVWGADVLELEPSVADVVLALEEENPELAADVGATPVDVWFDEWTTEELEPALVVLLDAPDVVDGRGATSAVVVLEAEVVLPDTDDPGPVDELLPVALVVACDPPLAVEEPEDDLVPDDVEVVRYPDDALLTEDTGEVLACELEG
jgi:hypothetical protein